MEASQLCVSQMLDWSMEARRLEMGRPLLGKLRCNITSILVLITDSYSGQNGQIPHHLGSRRFTYGAVHFAGAITRGSGSGIDISIHDAGKKLVSIPQAYFGSIKLHVLLLMYPGKA